MKKSNIDRLIIKGSLKYRSMFITGALVHCVFLVIFLMKGMLPLAVVNIFSILLYIFGCIFGLNKKNDTMHYGWMVAYYTEVVVHSVLTTLLVGAESSFQLYSLVIIPVAVYVLFFSCGFERFLATIISFVVIGTVANVLSILAVQWLEGIPYYPLSYADIDLLRNLNLIFSSVLLIGFSLMFALDIHVLIERLNESNRRLEYTATHDALTGLYNRHSLRSVFDRLVSVGEPFCIVLADIDDFKRVNDTYGHDAGDAVLVSVTSAIAGGIADGDIACRWGGEEILIILHGERSASIGRVQTIRERIISDNVAFDKKSIPVTLTYGFADSTEAQGIEKLISLADERLYHGKRSGKNVIISEDVR